ncbi:MAG: phage protein Gp27 family protein [Pseudomonadota bacterium]
MASKKKKKGRGRLSSIELLPVHADAIVADAAAALSRRDETQTEIYKGFVAELEQLQAEHRGELEFKIPSFSSFNRHSIKLEALRRRLDDTREIAGSIAKNFDAEASDDLTLIAAEAIKTLVFEITTDAGEAGMDPKGAMQLAAALRGAAQAQHVSTARRVKVKSTFEKDVDQAIDKVKKAKGLSDELAADIREKVLGVVRKKPEGDEATSGPEDE